VPTLERTAIQEDWIRLEEALNGDAVDSFKVAIKDPTPMNKRTFARAVFAYVEGMAHLMRQNALALHKASYIKYEPAELALLKEESYWLDDQGRVEKRPERRIGLRRMLRFSVAMFARFFDPAYTLDCSGDGWRRFCEASEIRHRVTHPKSGTALDITNEEIGVTWSAFTWIHDQLRAIYELSTKEFDRRMEDMKAALDAAVRPRQA
jgi:hypothetical protein